MLVIEKKIDTEINPTIRLVLPFELRCKNRLLTKLENGEEVGLFLDRGTVLRGGDRLLANDGRVVEVISAPEHLNIVRTDNTYLLMRAAYHLGNRHIPVDIQIDRLMFQKDHVLAEMIRGLGLLVEEDFVAFEPESGAYGKHVGHSHGHSAEGVGRGARIHEML
ncbi:urease accessory protein UreE [Ferrovum sp. PN-J185]|uniref:urease accessory protein UreE n=1 Tax=Ferrovum sp. PN-J185 TaxID=1356306 RepID=UPI0007918F41|nr:urease accessory protein UreE [Ferrovum sp. PN-J185]KXW56932.1 urease accessory protein UreE [Ferrovum sp. PN-J185]MCC6069195.1 urease accessory protein UreE [Ferrovum sp. PN-J185]MDE1892342.1 urease accessory protein UreE [Betaproteobacteria bacterium]